MSMKKIRRRLSQTFRFSIEGSLSELAEHLTIDDGGSVKENGVHVIPGFPDLNRKLSLSHSRIMGSSRRDGVVHENPRIGSDGESEEASGASDDVISPVKLRPKNRRLSEVCHTD
ncbi:hypothetical protein Cfor_03398 [Coptotermes formosanus]|uniref:Uncharacterized protein n=1 Tax=Coptotermes formosanus TaxID=36987 RepID=A0A6L2Q8E7_COPFO|nr:hypothetical protein Cfor_03398 [Coptotermes formosanus]